MADDFTDSGILSRHPQNFSTNYESGLSSGTYYLTGEVALPFRIGRVNTADELLKAIETRGASVS